MGQEAEKLLAARVAAIGRKTEKPLDPKQRALIDSFPRNVLEIEIPATRTMNEMHEGNRHGPGIKSQIAGAASPGPQTHQRGEEVGDAAAV